MRQAFNDLQIWQLAHKLTLFIYNQTKNFPGSEKFALIDQIRRASVSIAANIAEGFGRHSKKEFINFLYISLGSLEEVRYYLILSKDLGYLQQNILIESDNKIGELKAKLLAFINSLNRRIG